MREANRRLEELIESERNAQRSLITAQSVMVQTEKLAGLGQMVAGVAHEINNPLSFVSNNVAVLQRDLRGVVLLLALYAQADASIEEKNAQLFAEIGEVAGQMDLPYVLANLQEILARSRDGLKRIQQIVKDLRDFARLDESDMQEASINDGVQSTVTIVRGHAKKRGVVLVVELFEDLPLVTCNLAKVNQVVMNLITNAIDACGPNGQVTIRTRRGPGRHRTNRSLRHRQRHRPRDPTADFRSLFHHQAARPGNGPGPEHQLRNHQGSRRNDRRAKRDG